MALINMKRTKTEKKAEAKPMEVSSSREDYPWGLRITLEHESLKKLGIDVAKHSVGEKVRIVAETEIAHISQDQNMNRDRYSMSLQITKMGFDSNNDDLDWDTALGDAEKILQKRKVIS